MMSRSLPFRVVAASAVALVSLLTTSCTQKLEPSGAYDPIEPPAQVDTSTLRFGEIVLPDETSRQPGCPWIPKETATTIYTAQHAFESYFTNNDRHQKMECHVGKPPRVASTYMKFTVVALKRPTPVLFAPELNPISYPQTPAEKPFSNLQGKYPGVGFVYPRRMAWWTCGNVQVQFDSHYDAPSGAFVNPARYQWFDNLQALEAAIKSLCGTMDKPSKHVTDWPHIVWDRYDAFGGTSPEKYGIPRPKEPADTPYPGP